MEPAAMPSARIDPAKEVDFAIGQLTVRPSRREVVGHDGDTEVLEHRVMQVLIALAKAEGAIVTRDELTLSCWDGRIVGEDAINRVISRLRKVANGVGAGSFRIETVTRVGYRLVAAEGLARTVENDGPLVSPRRRTFVFGGAAVGFAALAGGTALIYQRRSKTDVPPEVASLMTAAWQAWTEDASEGYSRALGIYRQVTVLAPDYPDGWGLLGCAYATGSHFRSHAEAEVLRERARAAGRRALNLEPQNAYGKAALAYAQPFRGNWLSMEKEFRRALAHQPDKQILLHALGLSLCRVGRFAEGASFYERMKESPRGASMYQLQATALWGAGRLEEAERLLTEAASLYPTHANVWLARFDMLLFGGRPSAAIGMAEDIDGHPGRLPAALISERAAVARAIRSRDSAEANRVMALQMDHAAKSTSQAEDTIQFASALGRLDEAFVVMDAYQFSRGFKIPNTQDASAQRSAPMLEDRETAFLFLPSTRAMRGDIRFASLVEELGLERYWREARVQPDYRRG